MIASTTPSNAHIKNFGNGLVPYAWEEGGPTRAVRAGKMPLERAVDALGALPLCLQVQVSISPPGSTVNRQDGIIFA